MIGQNYSGNKQKKDSPEGIFIKNLTFNIFYLSIQYQLERILFLQLLECNLCGLSFLVWNVKVKAG